MTCQVSALFEDHDQAAAAVRSLQEHQFQERELTVIAKADEATAQELDRYEQSVEREDSRTGVWTGSALGAAVGGYLGLLSMVLIPALPLFIVGGAAVGGLLGKGLGGLGVADQHVGSVEETLRGGGALALVHEPDPKRAQLAQDLLKQHAARSVTVA
jgi:uncharacterized membrane protein